MNPLVFANYGAFIVFGLGLLFAFSNGFRDSSTIVATVVSTRALTPNKAFFFCALCEFLGVFLGGSAVAMTIGRQIFGKSPITPVELSVVLICAVGTAIVWGVISWWRAWPTSNNHALMAGLFGASWAGFEGNLLHVETIVKIFVVLILSPLFGFFASLAVTKISRFLGEWMTPRVVPTLGRLQVVSCLLVSCAHGANDGQIVLGILILALGVSPFLATSSAPDAMPITWTLRGMVALTMASGVLLGGRRILRKLGMKFFRIRIVQGLSAQLTSAATILTCTTVGFPASTTQVIAGSIMGAGVATNPRAVRWHIAQEIFLSWVITFPAVAVVSFLLAECAKGFLRCSP